VIKQPCKSQKVVFSGLFIIKDEFSLINEAIKKDMDKTKTKTKTFLNQFYLHNIVI